MSNQATVLFIPHGGNRADHQHQHEVKIGWHAPVPPEEGKRGMIRRNRNGPADQQ
jgi:hypothetical protein